MIAILIIARERGGDRKLRGIDIIIIHGCQMAIAGFLDRMLLALRASGQWLRYATLQNLPSCNLAHRGGLSRRVRGERGHAIPYDWRISDDLWFGAESSRVAGATFQRQDRRRRQPVRLCLLRHCYLGIGRGFR